MATTFFHDYIEFAQIHTFNTISALKKMKNIKLLKDMIILLQKN